MEKSQTCEEHGVHLMILFWHLLMNLTNQYLLKELLNGPLKNKIILLFTMLYI